MLPDEDKAGCFSTFKPNYIHSTWEDFAYSTHLEKGSTVFELYAAKKINF